MALANIITKQIRQRPSAKRVWHVAMLVLSLGSLSIDAALAAPQAAPQAALEEHRRLETALQHYEDITAAGGWPTLAGGPTLRLADHGARVATLRRQLEITGDLEASAIDRDNFTAAVERAVRRFQARHGLLVDGLVGPETLAALNVPAPDRVQQLRLNLNRAQQSLAWPQSYVLVNAAGFALTAVLDGKVAWRSRVIVGKRRTPTPELTGEITRIVLNPFWNVPPSIAVNEMIPRIRRDPGYLLRQKIRVFSSWGKDARELDPGRIDWSRSAVRGYKFRQDPGEGNALGRVKFLFDNRFGVYLHDTPTKPLFERPHRTFSHGCIRLQNPLQLAQLLLRNEPSWDASSIHATIDSGRNRQIRLRQPIAIFVVYRTAWVDPDGRVQFRRDIYARDRPALAGLGNAASAFCEPNR